MQLENVPGELRAYTQWVCWKYENRGVGKSTKVPYSAVDARMAGVDTPDSWCSFDVAVENLQYFDGIGFVLTHNDPYCFIDFDESDNPDEVKFQQGILQHFDSYAERSPSSKGLHIICKGAIPSGRRYGKTEIYSASRYMTVTGDVFLERPIRYKQSDVSTLWEQLNASNRTNLEANHTHDGAEILTDLEVYNMAQYAENGAKFLTLWNGDTMTYHGGDHSRADFALIDILSFYTQNREQVTRLFRMSGLGQRQKAKRDDYITSMISKSFDNIVPPVDVSGLANKIDEYVNNVNRKQILGYKEHEALYDRPINPTGQPAQPKKEERNIDKGAFALPPGLLGDIAKFVYDQSYKPIPEISMTAAVGFMAGICGRSYNVSNTGLNQYLLLLAGTGRGKEEMARGINKLVQSMLMQLPTIGDFAGPSDLASGQALLRYFSDHPTKSICSIFGEFGIRLKAISQPKAMSSELMLQKVLLDFFGKSGASDVIMPTAYSDAERNTKPIPSPAFTMIGESSPDWFYNSIDEDMIRSGLLPRFTVVEYGGPRPPSNYQSHLVVPSRHLQQGLAGLVTSSLQLLQQRRPYEVPFDDEAQKLSVDLDKRCDRKINAAENTILAELWNRAHLKTMRIAALIAVGCNPFKPIITPDCFRWSERFVTHGIDKLSDRFFAGEVGHTTDENAQIEQIKKHIVQYMLKDFSQVAKYGVSAAMHNNRIIPWVFISRSCLNLAAFRKDKLGASTALRRAVVNMLDNGDLQEVSKMQAIKEYGYSGRCFVLKNTKVLGEIKHKIGKEVF